MPPVPEMRGGESVGAAQGLQRPGRSGATVSVCPAYDDALREQRERLVDAVLPEEEILRLFLPRW